MKLIFTRRTPVQSDAPEIASDWYDYINFFTKQFLYYLLVSSVYLFTVKKNRFCLWLQIRGTVCSHCTTPPAPSSRCACRRPHSRPRCTSLWLLYLQNSVCCGWPWPSHAEPPADQSEPGFPAKPEGPAVVADDCREEGREGERDRERKIMSITKNGYNMATLIIASLPNWCLRLYLFEIGIIFTFKATL